MDHDARHAAGNWQRAADSRCTGRRTRKRGTIAFERSKDVEITFAPRTTTVIELKLKTKGVPYWSRPDLGIDPEDVKVDGSQMTVTVHSVGAVDAPASKVVLRDQAGKTIATADVPALKAPVDLTPKTADVTLAGPSGSRFKGASVTIECGGNRARDHADEQQRDAVAAVRICGNLRESSTFNTVPPGSRVL